MLWLSVCVIQNCCSATSHKKLLSIVSCDCRTRHCERSLSRKHWTAPINTSVRNVPASVMHTRFLPVFCHSSTCCTRHDHSTEVYIASCIPEIHTFTFLGTTVQVYVLLSVASPSILNHFYLHHQKFVNIADVYACYCRG